MAPLVWLITGCSSGFGQTMVRQALQRGDHVIATARRPESLKALQQAGAAVLQLDVTSDQKTIDDTVAGAIAIYGRIDVLVNNAAYLVAGAMEDISDELLKAQFDTNVFGAFKVTRAVLPHLRQRKSGTMVFISSISGWIGHGYTGPYAGSKFALEGLVESLSRETQHTGVKTLLIEPGRFRTLILSGNNLRGVKSKIPDYVDGSSKHLDILAADSENQPGDPEKGVAVILDLVRQEGIAAGKDIPLRFPLGLDAYEEIGRKCAETLKILEDWKHVVTSTDHQE